MLTDPWPHVVYDDYFDSELFQNMKRELALYLKNNVPRINTLTKIEDFTKLPETKKCIDSAKIDESTIKLFPEYRKYETLTVRPQVLICYGTYEHRIHDEVESKVLSAVTYITATSGHGTRLYDKDKNFVKEVEWKENRMMIFTGVTGKTWHDYYSEPNNIRITMNIFLERYTK